MTSSIRGSDVWLKEDVKAMLSAILVTNESAARFNGASAEYSAGFAACMVAVAVTFGLPVQDLVTGRAVNWTDNVTACQT